MHLPAKAKQSGFTLIEILIALSISALVSVLAWKGVRQVIQSTQRIQVLQHRTNMQGALWQQLVSDSKLLNTIKKANKVDGTQFGVDGKSSLVGTSLHALPNGFQLEGIFRNPNLASNYQLVKWTLESNILTRTQHNRDGEALQVEAWPLPVQALKIRLWEFGTWSWVHAVGNTQQLIHDAAYPALSTQNLDAVQLQPESMQGEQSIILEVQISSEGKTLTHLLPAGAMP